MLITNINFLLSISVKLNLNSIEDSLFEGWNQAKIRSTFNNLQLKFLTLIAHSYDWLLQL